MKTSVNFSGNFSIPTRSRGTDVGGLRPDEKDSAKPPYIAPIEDQKCSGCNLRVSNDVISSVLVEQKLTQCDQCGRIVYVER